MLFDRLAGRKRRRVTRTTADRPLALGLVALVAMLAAGCGGDEEDAAAAATGEAPKSGFVADAQGSGARMWIDAKLNGDSDALVELWAAELGPVLGYSAHLRFDTEHLENDPAGAPSAEPALGAAAEEAVHLATALPGDVAFGGTRRSPTLGEADLGAATLLGQARLHARAASTSRLSLERVVARRADGGYLQLTALGGELTTVGAP